MKPDIPHILLVNPWIHDFAAYDFWAKPFGLLGLGGILRKHGLKVSLIDCLDRFHPRAKKADPRSRQGRGPYIKTKIPKPKGLENIPRTFSRYGIKPEWFLEDLSQIEPPDLILVTSMMTYWYPGVKETIDLIKSIFPKQPVVLGGIYASLCREHASINSGADLVATGSGENRILGVVDQYTGFASRPLFDPDDLDSYPYPCFDLLHKIPCVAILTSKGCPFSCRYCASSFLNPARKLRKPELVVGEIEFWHKKYGVNDFVFYDDALLIDSEAHAMPIFESIIRSGLKIRFHTPNALHVRQISQKAAGLMKRAGFVTIRLGLETTDFKNRSSFDEKVSLDQFYSAVFNLKKAGFEKDQVGAYLLTCLPDQTMEAIASSIKAVKQQGILPIPAYYTPIPHTEMWGSAVLSSRYDLESDPIFTNNAILPCQQEPFSWKTISCIKNLVSS